MPGANLQGEPTGAGTEIENYIQLLRSTDQQDQAKAMSHLKTLAQASNDNRVSIIRSLIQLLNDPGAEFDTRRACMNILGDLKAIEAINALVKHLADLEGITGLSEHWYPAVEALHKIGPPAIPALSKALADPDPKIRKYAAETLTNIGGETAQERLEQALKTEQDSIVRNTLENGIRYLRDSTRQQRRSNNH